MSLKNPRAGAYVLSFLFLIMVPAFFPSISVASEPSFSTLTFQIAQETLRRNGVLIVRPRDFDLRIINLFRTERIQSLEDYARWLKANIRYQKDGLVDRWASPERTLSLRQGDCEDYTLFNAAVLKVLGYKPHFVTLKRRREAHAICVFKVEGNYFWFDNAELKKTSLKTLEEFARHVLLQENYSQFWEWDLKDGTWNLIDRAFDV